MMRPLSRLESPLRFPDPPTDSVRHIALGGRAVSYTLIRSRRRTLALTIDHRGLRVGVPNLVAMGDVEKFIRSHAEWILRKLDAWSAERGPKPMDVCDGASLPVLGEQWVLRLAAGNNDSLWIDAEMVLALPSGADARDSLRRALQQRALALFRARAAHLFRDETVELPRLALSNARTRWGSCSARTGLRFNWRLIHLPLPLVDYVVAHELAHLREMNHSAHFWHQVERLYPDYRLARKALRAHAVTIPHI
ncbi:MAG: SprT family zinc-dependent metalloprotease [Rhodocyclaceae bacterium]